MSQLKDLVEFISNADELPDEDLENLADEMSEMLKAKSEAAWLANNLESLDDITIYVLQMAAQVNHLPEKVNDRARELAKTLKPGFRAYNYALVLAFQDDEFGLQTIENYLFDEKEPVLVMPQADALFEIHTDRARALLERYLKEGKSEEGLEHVKYVLGLWNTLEN